MTDNKQYEVSMGVHCDDSNRTYCDMRIITSNEELAELLRKSFASGKKDLINEFIKLLQLKLSETESIISYEVARDDE